MRNFCTYKRLFFCLILSASTHMLHAQSPFTPGNLVVVNVNSSTATSLIEYSTTGVLVQTISVPSSGPNAITISSSATSEGVLSRSDGGAYLGYAGYRTGTNSSGTDRVFARVDANGIVNTSSAIPNAEGYGANNVRGCVFSNDGLRFWASGTGTGGGIRTNTFGSVSGSTQVSTTISNVRTVNIFNGQLYCSSATGAYQGVSSVGSGLPITTGNTVTIMPGMPVVSGPSSYGFSISPGSITNGSVMYVADDRASALGGIQKWIYNGSTWSLSYTFGTGVANIGARGVAVNYNSFNNITGYGAVIYATTAEASVNRIIKITDNGPSAIPSTLVTTPASTIFKGIAFSPVANTPPVVTGGNAVATVGSFYSYNVVATNGPTSFSASPIPPGMTFNSGSGVLSGIPTVGGIYTIILNAANAFGVGSATLVLKVCDISATSTQTDVLCNGNQTGAAALSVTGGVLPYSYTWLPSGGTSSNASNLAAGIYTVNIADAGGCTTSKLIQITQPAPFTSYGTHNNITCAGFCDGALSMFAVGGVSPYTYTWSAAGYYSPIVTNLCAGSYTVTATDFNGCITSYSATIVEPAPLSITTTQTPILCNGGTSVLNLIGSGGVGPYYFSVSPYPLQTLTTYNMPAGTHAMLISDANGCFAFDAVTINEPPLLIATESYLPIQCFGGNTQLTVAASGGTGSYQYQLNGGAYQSSPIFTISAGPYAINVKDSFQCVTTINGYMQEPDQLVVSASATPITCSINTSIIDVQAYGGTGTLEYQLNGGGYSSNSLFNVLIPGVYTVDVRDSNACTSQTTVTVISTSNLNVSETHVNPVCYGGTSSVIISATGGTLPYTGIGTFTQMAGTMLYTVTDAAGCMASINVTVSQPSSPNMTAALSPASVCNGTVVTPIATGMVSYNWSGGLSNNLPFVANANNVYTVTGTDALGCTTSTTLTLTVALSNSQLSFASTNNVSTLNVNASYSSANDQVDGSSVSYTDNNCQLIAQVQDVPGGGALSNTIATVYIDSTIQTYNTQPYVRRHFQISSSNASNATITLYLSQDDFDDYNIANTSLPSLPINGSNSDPNISHIRITKINGLLGAGVASIITPTMYWNASAQYWEATFPDNVFGTYYFHSVNGANAVLPVDIINFTGESLNGTHLLTWTSANEHNLQGFELLHSIDAIHFESIYTVNAQSLQTTTVDKEFNYSFQFLTPAFGHNYYRLKSVDIDQRSHEYEKQLDVVETNTTVDIAIYPNPFNREITLQWHETQQANYTINVYDVSGRLIEAKQVVANKGANHVCINSNNWTTGIYMISILKNQRSLYSKIVSKEN